MTFITLVPPIYYNIRNYGALVNGSTDDTTSITNAIAAASASGGGIVVVPGIAGVSSSITVPNNVSLVGAGQGSGLKMLAGFSGAQMLLLNGDYAQVRDMQLLAGPSTTYSSNPAANGIQITGARRCIVDRVVCYYINGWMVQSSSTAGVANYNCRFTDIYGFNCAKGIHTLGASGSSFGMGAYFHNCGMDFTSGSGDCYLIEDSNDVLMSNIYGEYLGGTGVSIHVKGACSGLYVSNFDIGPYPGPVGNVVLIESGTNGSPKLIGFSNGIIEGGSNGVFVSAGQQIRFNACEFFNNNSGIVLAGGDAVLIEGCTFSLNGQTAGTGRYDITSSTGGNVEILNNHFLTPQGSLAGQTNNTINSTAGQVVVSGNRFAGSGYTSANIFAGFPNVIRENYGYNPLGNFTAPTITASPFTPALQPFDCTVFISGGTVSSVKIGGVVTGLTSGTFRVPAQQSITVTYTVAPTMTWFGD